MHGRYCGCHTLPAVPFRRPWAIVPYVQELYKCAAVVASELVVNVDNPEEASQWAAQSNATKGWVVPVLSANVHELRGFNRGAQIARGDIIITLQVRRRGGSMTSRDCTTGCVRGWHYAYADGRACAADKYIACESGENVASERKASNYTISTRTAPATPACCLARKTPTCTSPPPPPK